MTFKRDVHHKRVGMNKVYKVIWNASLGAWVAVSELATAKGKSSKSKTVGAVLLAVSGVTFSADALAVTVGTGSNNTNCYVNENGQSSAGVGGSLSSNTVAIAGGGVACTPTTGSIAIGGNATTQGVRPQGDTTSNTAGYNQSIAIGQESRATGDQAIALGANTKATGHSSVAIGGDDVDRVID